VTCPSPAPAPEPVLCDRARAEALVHRYGRAPLDYFKLWPDKSYFFSADLASMIAYGTAWSVAVSLGDPIGPAPSCRLSWSRSPASVPGVTPEPPSIRSALTSLPRTGSRGSTC